MIESGLDMYQSDPGLSGSWSMHPYNTEFWFSIGSGPFKFEYVRIQVWRTEFYPIFFCYGSDSDIPIIYHPKNIRYNNKII